MTGFHCPQLPHPSTRGRLKSANSDMDTLESCCGGRGGGGGVDVHQASPTHTRISRLCPNKPKLDRHCHQHITYGALSKDEFKQEFVMRSVNRTTTREIYYKAE